jgi:hypothetical protein
MVTGDNVGAITLRNLVFQNGTSPGGSAGGAVRLVGTTFTIDHDTFVGNRVTAAGGGGLYLQGAIPLAASTDPWRITDSLFAGNRATPVGGGAQIYAINSSPPPPVIVSGNQFVGNQVTPPPSGPATGGGLFIANVNSDGRVLTQSGNLFDGNAVLGPAPLDVVGGGEFVQGLRLDSTSDRFVRNTLPAPGGAGSAEGAGLALEGCLGSTINQQVANLVSAGNAVNAGGTHVEGAGLYVGCSTGPVALTARDSTISGNQAGPGAAGGIFGGPDDQLTLTNSIVTGNPSGADITGFSSVSASFDDACAGGAPLAGAGNICADPVLAGAGPPAADVHETANSPTIDKGSNALVPAGLTTDFEGDPRIINGTVDMGADEFQPAAGGGGAGAGGGTGAGAGGALVPPLSFSISRIKANKNGSLTLALFADGPGSFVASATTRITSRYATAARKKKRKRKTITYGTGQARAAAAGAVTLTIKPTRAARAALKRAKRLTVNVRVAFSPADGGPQVIQTALARPTAPRPPKRHRRKH